MSFRRTSASHTAQIAQNCQLTSKTGVSATAPHYSTFTRTNTGTPLQAWSGKSHILADRRIPCNANETPTPLQERRSTDEQACIDKVIAQDVGRQGVLLAILEAVQERNPHKYLPIGTLSYIAAETGAPLRTRGAWFDPDS